MTSCVTKALIHKPLLYVKQKNSTTAGGASPRPKYKKNKIISTMPFFIFYFIFIEFYNTIWCSTRLLSNYI